MESVPSGGITWRQSKQLGMFIYYFYSLLGSRDPPQAGHDYVDILFYNSVFGEVLLQLCHSVQNLELEPLWAAHLVQCTVAFVRDLSEFFHLFHKSFVDYQMGADIKNCGIQDAFDPATKEAFLIIPALTGVTNFGAPSTSILSPVQEFCARFAKFWGQGYYDTTTHPRWTTTPCYLVFLTVPTTLPTSPTPKKPESERLSALKGKEALPFHLFGIPQKSNWVPWIRRWLCDQLLRPRRSQR